MKHGLRQCVLLALVSAALSACSVDGGLQRGGHGAGGAGWADPASAAVPEAGSGWTRKQAAYGPRQMVVTAHPLASAAAREILLEGGSAVDAAIAAQMVLGLVEPQSSGIGGGGFLLNFDGQNLQAWDGRETAPAAVGPEHFLSRNGQAIAFGEASSGASAVAVPGLVPMLEAVHRRHGVLPWPRLFAPAMRLAEEGFPVGARLAHLLQREPRLLNDAEARRLYFDGEGRPWPQGHVLRNPALAATLRRVASAGARALSEGELAQAMVDRLTQGGGKLRMADLAGYRPLERPAQCFDHDRWRVCGMPPPSAGGIAVGQMLGVLKHHGIAKHRPVDNVWPVEAIHLFTEASRLAFADRERWIADPDFLPPSQRNVAALLAPAYLGQRASLIGAQSMGVAEAGLPDWDDHPTAASPALEFDATTHLSIVDAQGRAVAMTSSIERAFGAGIMVRGFLLNNQMTDFSFLPSVDGRPVANRVEGGKRPRSAMAPTMAFDRTSGELHAVVGSPGGPSIIPYVAKALIALLEWDISPQEAVDLPNVGSRNGPTELENGRFDRTRVDALRAKGHRVLLSEMTSGVHLVVRARGEGRGWWGAADGRREGVAVGD